MRWLARYLRFIIALLITSITLYFALQGVNFNDVLNDLGQIDYRYAPLAFVAFCVSYAARVYRWQLLFYPYHLRWSKVLSTLTIGYFLSNITPGRAGDLVRPFLIANIERVPIPRALPTVVVERTLDLLSVVVMLIVLL